MYKFLNLLFPLIIFLFDIICILFYIYYRKEINHVSIIAICFIGWIVTSIIYYSSKYVINDYSNITFSDMLVTSLYMINFLILLPLYMFVNSLGKYFRNFYFIYILSIIRKPSRIITNYLFNNYRYFSCNLLVVVYTIRYFFMACFSLLYIEIVKDNKNKFLSTVIADILIWILYGFIILIFIKLFKDLGNVLGEDISIKPIIVIIVLIFIFGLLGIKNGKIEWVFIALILTSTKDILSTDIKVLYSYGKIDEFTEDEFKKRIVDLKYTLLLFIPVVYFTLMLSEIIVNTEIYKHIMCKIMDNNSNKSFEFIFYINKLTEFIFEGSIKFLLTAIFTFLVYYHRRKIFEKIIEWIMLRN